MQTIPKRFGGNQTDLEAMQRAMLAVCESIKQQVKEGIASGGIDEDLLMSALFSLAHTSARAQEEYAELRGDDETLPCVWTAIAGMQ